MDSNGNPRNYISDTILISVLTAFGYITAYCFESGYCTYFNIPTELIEISITRVVTVTLAMFGSLLALGHFVSPFIGLVSSESIVKRLIGKHILVAMFIGIAWWSVNDVSTFAFILIVPVLELYFDFIHPLLSKRHISGYANKMTAFQSEFSEERARSIWFNDRIQRLMRRDYAILVLVGLIALMIASGLGRSQAKNQKQFLTTKSPNSIIILRQYGSSLIGVNIDQHNIVINGIHVIERSNLKEYGPLIIQKTGVIKPNNYMKFTNN